MVTETPVDAESVVKTEPASHHRILYLDGLRGLAIILVIFYHAFFRWHTLVPYGDEFRYFPLFQHGRYGVQLFFMISGFVIFMSLERSRNFRGFMIRRWIRLFPAMLICSLIIYFTADFFHERPAGMPEFRDLLPGLTFISPYWWEVILGSPQGELEGVFWSLYVEIKLYLVAGFFYFLIGGPRMIWIMIGLFLIAVGALILDPYFQQQGWQQAVTVMKMLSGKPCGWFAAGALFYRYHSERKKGMLVLAIVTALASAMAEGSTAHEVLRIDWGSISATLIIALLFIIAALSETLQHILCSRILLTIGFISYPLYLVHENMMISLIIKVGNAMPWIPSLLLPVIPVLLVVGLAWLVACIFEPRLRFYLKNCYFKLYDRGWV